MTTFRFQELGQASSNALHTCTQHDQLPPVCVALVDDQGDLLYFERMEGAPVRTIQIAIAKAYTAARMGVSTQQFRQRLLNENLLCSEFMDPKLCALPGGVMLTLGQATHFALGVSGRTLADDEALALGLVEAIQKHFSTCSPN